MKNKVLVTGSCGFIGHHLVKELKLRGFYVIGADNLYGGDKKYADLSDEFLLKNCGDLTEDELLDVKWIFHLAAIPSIPYSIKNPQQTQKNNVDETLSLLLLSKKVGIEKFVFSSSSSVYGEQTKFPTDEKCQTIPISPYAVQKLCAEQYCETFRKIYRDCNASFCDRVQPVDISPGTHGKSGSQRQYISICTGLSDQPNLGFRK